MAWNDLATERPVIATMASVSYGTIPRSKIKSYAEDDLGLIGEEVEIFVSIMRHVEIKSSAKNQETNPEEVKGVVQRVAKTSQPMNKSKFNNPRVRHPRP